MINGEYKMTKKGVQIVEANDVALCENCDIVFIKNKEDLIFLGKTLEIDIFIKCKDTYYLFGNGITFVYQDGKKQ